MYESTFVMIKPDCVRDGHADEIISMIEEHGYKITEKKEMILTEEMVKEYYPHVVNKPFFPAGLAYMTSGPVLAMIAEGENAVNGMIDFSGVAEENPELRNPKTTRERFGKNKSQNAFHRSDSPNIAKTEIERFFGFSS